MILVSIVPSRLRFVERGQVWSRSTRLAQDSRGILVILGISGGLSRRNCQDMPNPRGYCGSDREGARRQAANITRNNPSCRTTGSITGWWVGFARKVIFHGLLSLNVGSSEEWSGRDCWDIRRDAIGFQVPSQDSEEVAGIHRRENEPGPVVGPRCFSFCWVINISFQTVRVLLQLRET